MAVQPSTVAAKGDAPAITSPTKATPAPVKPYVGGDFTREAEEGARLGRNQCSAPSSVSPGTMLSSDGIEVQRPDSVLDGLIAHGTRSDDPSGLANAPRDIGTAGRVPTHPHLSGASPSPKVPGSVEAAAEAPQPRDPYAS
jgi:hypothetical protein